MGIRRNNADLCKSAKYRTKEIFHGRSHPKYQKIEIYDTLQDTLMPKDVRDLNDSFASITTSGNNSAGQDFDFVLEEKNRQLKAWIPKGTPTDQIWQTVCRNDKKLEKVKLDTLSLLGVVTEKGALKWPELDDQVDTYRCILRKSNYLDHIGDHISLTGHALDENLVNYIGEANKRRIHMIRNDILGEDIEDIPNMRHPVPVTVAERQKNGDVSRMLISELQKEITKRIEVIPDEVQYHYHIDMYNSEIKGKKKEKYVSFLNELNNALLNSNQNNDLEESTVWG